MTELEQKYEEILESARVQTRLHDWYMKEKAKKVNPAIENLFDMVKFVNRDGWELGICYDTPIHSIRSFNPQYCVEVGLEPVEINFAEMFSAKGHVDKITLDATPHAIWQIAEQIVTKLAETKVKQGNI